jgi:hypothetical protein
MTWKHVWIPIVLVLLAAPAAAQPPAWTYSPLTAVGVGPSGPATAKIAVEPYCCPSTAVVVKASSPVAEGDFQWVNLGLTVPAGLEIPSVEVCYSLKSARQGGTYISQTRLTDMTTPDAAHVKMDDPTDRKDPGPVCYVSRAGFTSEGTVTLALKVVFADSRDEIRIGMVKLGHKPMMKMQMKKTPAKMKGKEGG